jgi:hypothetical protein
MFSGPKAENFKQSGQAMIESMVAISVLAVAFLSIYGLLSQSLGLYRVTTNRYAATYLAAEGIELAKNLIDTEAIRDSKWPVMNGDFEMDYTTLDFSSAPQYNGNHLCYSAESGYFRDNLGMEACNGAVKSPFVREITIKNDDDNPDQITIHSIVRWTDRAGGSFDVDLEDHFFNWRGMEKRATP